MLLLRTLARKCFSPMAQDCHWAARAGLIFAAALFLLPYLNPYHPLPLPGFYSEWLAFACGCLCIAFVPFAGRGTLRIPVVSLAPLLLLVVILVQQANGLSPYLELTTASAGYLLWCAGLMAVGATLASSFQIRQVAVVLAFAALIGGIVNALFSALQLHAIITGSMAPNFLVSSLPDGATRVYGNLAQPNHFSAYMLIGVNSALYLHLAGKLTRRQTLSIIIPMALFTLPSGSRSLILYFSLTGIIWKDFFLESIRQHSRWILSLGLLAAIISVPLLMFRHEISFQSFAVILSRFMHWDDISGDRMLLAEHAMRMFLDAPIMGVGFHLFALHMFEQAASMPEAATRLLDVHSHNFFLQLLAVSGVSGFLAVTLPLLRWTLDVYRIPSCHEKKWALATLGILGLHSLVEYPLWFAYFLGIAALLLGMLSPRNWTVAADWKMRAIAMAAGGSGIFLLLFYAADYRTIESMVYGPPQTQTMIAGRDSAGKEALLEVYQRGLFARYVELNQPGWVVKDAAPLADKLLLSRRAISFAPNEEITYRHAILLAANGDTNDSLSVLRLALAVYPQGRQATRERVEILSRQNPILFKPLLDLIESGDPP